MECPLSSMQEHIPEIESNIPLPESAKEAMPELSPREELEMRARTVKMISDLTGKPIEPSPQHRGQALEAANQMLGDKNVSPQLALYENETIAYLAGLVAQHDTYVVKDLAQIKTYVVNKLVEETRHPEAKYRLQALRSLGEIDGVDAFKRRSEVTHKQSIEEVEKELLSLLEKAERRTVDVQARVVDGDVTDV
jgi:hypothetical protein